MLAVPVPNVITTLIHPFPESTRFEEIVPQFLYLVSHHCHGALQKYDQGVRNNGIVIALQPPVERGLGLLEKAPVIMKGIICVLEDWQYIFSDPRFTLKLYRAIGRFF